MQRTGRSYRNRPYAHARGSGSNPDPAPDLDSEAASEQRNAIEDECVAELARSDAMNSEQLAQKVEALHYVATEVFASVEPEIIDLIASIARDAKRLSGRV